jgi:hypothetical protein
MLPCTDTVMIPAQWPSYKKVSEELIKLAKKGNRP